MNTEKETILSAKNAKVFNMRLLRGEEKSRPLKKCLHLLPKKSDAYPLHCQERRVIKHHQALKWNLINLLHILFLRLSD